MESIDPNNIRLIGDYLSKALEIEYSLIIPAWQGFIISCTLPQGGKAVFWLHARTIDGLFSKYGIVEQAALQAAEFVLAYIPGGSWFSGTLKERLGEPPQENQTYLPQVHRLEYGSFEVSRGGQIGTAFDILSTSSYALVSSLTRATRTLSKAVRNVIGKESSQEPDEHEYKSRHDSSSVHRSRVGYTIIRFRSRFEELRTQKVEEDKLRAKSEIVRIVKGMQAHLEPSGLPVPSFKVFNQDDAKRFLRQARADAFPMRFIGAKIV